MSSQQGKVLGRTTLAARCFRLEATVLCSPSACNEVYMGILVTSVHVPSSMHSVVLKLMPLTQYWM